MLCIPASSTPHNTSQLHHPPISLSTGSWLPWWPRYYGDWTFIHSTPMVYTLMSISRKHGNKNEQLLKTMGFHPVAMATPVSQIFFATIAMLKNNHIFMNHIHSAGSMAILLLRWRCNYPFDSWWRRWRWRHLTTTIATGLLVVLGRLPIASLASVVIVAIDFKHSYSAPVFNISSLNDTNLL